MARIEVEQMRFTYPGGAEAALSDVTLDIASGSFVLLGGPSGCGKTTLLRLLKPELRPAGELSGRALLDGRPLEQLAPLESACRIGMVMQHPDSQIVMESVRQELVFTLENIGLATEEIRTRVAELAHDFGISHWLDDHTFELSGGRKQLLNLASVLLLQPDVLLLDEPTAQLDPIAARQFLHTVGRLNRELGMTVVMSEHRLEEALPLADRVVLLERGAVRTDGTAREAAAYLAAARPAYAPAAASLHALLAGRVPAGEAGASSVPVSVREGRLWFERAAYAALPTKAAVPGAAGGDAGAGADRADKDGNGGNGGNGGSTDGCEAAERVRADRDEAKRGQAARRSVAPLLALERVSFGRSRPQPLVLRGLSLQVRSGECVALLGGNGAGKTTLLHLAAGLLRPVRGEALLDGRPLGKIADARLYRELALLPQNTLSFFAAETAGEELEDALRSLGDDGRPDERDRLVDLFGLRPLLGRHPHDLSGGERQKLALAAALLRKPRLLLLDEPTKGVDPEAKRELAELLRQRVSGGLTVLLATHDAEFAAATATRCALLFDGEIAAEGAPGSFFAGHYYYTTAINRIVRRRWPHAVTEEEALQLWEQECESGYYPQ